MLNWVEIDKGNLRKNFDNLRGRLTRECKVMGVVKSNAYGHGMVEVAKELAMERIDWLAVVTLNEGVKLRESGIKIPILILSYTEHLSLPEIIRYSLTPSVYNMDVARAISYMAQRYGEVIEVHIKIDTGMHRLGFFPEELVDKWVELTNLPGIKIGAFYSHFADANDREYSDNQIQKMNDVLFQMQKNNFFVPMTHVANSQATYLLPKSHFDMVRVGGLLYGLAPYAPEFLSIATFKAKIINIKKLPKGVSIGYGRTYKTNKETTVAVLSVGYAEGYGRHLSNKGVVLIGGSRCPVVGRICMNQTMVDVSLVEDIKIGDEAVLIGKQGNESIGVTEVAERLETIPYEVMARIPEHVLRRYV